MRTNSNMVGHVNTKRRERRKEGSHLFDSRIEIHKEFEIRSKCLQMMSVN